MSRKFLLVSILFIVFFTFISCVDGVNEGETKYLDLLVKDNEEISAETELIIENIDLKKGIFVSSFSSSRDIDNGNGNKYGLYKTQKGDYILVPDEESKCTFKGKDIGIYGKTKVFFKTFDNIDDDFCISSSDYPTLGIGVVDEYYYVDFSSAAWSDLDPTRVVIVEDQYITIGGHSIIQYGYTDKNKYSVFDFSLFPGFGVYSYVSKNFLGLCDWERNIHVMNPKRISDVPTVKKNGKDYVAVIDVDISDSRYYVIEASYSNEQELASLLEEPHARYYDGVSRDVVMIPVVDETNNKVLYYTGKVDKPFIFNINMKNCADNDEIKFECKTSDASSYPGLYDYKDITSEGYKITAQKESGYQTWAFKITETGHFGIDCHYDVVKVERGHNGHGNVLGGNQDDTSATGYIVFKYADLNVGDTLCTITRTPSDYIECSHIKWNKESKLYECQGKDSCGKTYTYNDILLKVKDSSFKDISLVADLPDFGKTIIRNCDFLISERYPELMGNEGGNAEGSDGCYASFGHTPGSTDDSIWVALKEVWTDENHMVTKAVYDIKINMKTWKEEKTWNDVLFTYQHVHRWDFSDDLMAECSCGERRPYMSRLIKAGTISLNLNGLRKDDMVTILEPVSGFEQSLPNWNGTFPPLNEDAIVYFIPSNKNCKLTLSGSGTSYNLHASY